MDKLQEYHAKLQAEIEKALKSNYDTRAQRMANITRENCDEFIAYVDGKIAALRGISDFADELLDEVGK